MSDSGFVFLSGGRLGELGDDDDDEEEEEDEEEVGIVSLLESNLLI